LVSPDEAFQVLLEVTRVLETLDVPYVVGGSLASSLHGIPRSTQDADLVAALRADHIRPFIAGVEGSFYISPERVEAAVRRRASFNLIHLKSMIKVDLFVFTETPLARQEMARRQVLPIPGEPEAHLQVATPEDTILQKLLWYRKGGGTSERQWTDILGVIKVQGRALDLGYLKEWATRSGVEDLLAQAFADAGISMSSTMDQR
jgi:Nucleotidyl transferase AbiEii toxin, Type IV TA system